MPRQLRIEYPGAVYHVMNRGDRREPIFCDDLDHKRFLATPAEACTKTDWQVHAYCLMPNHFRLVVETPNSAFAHRPKGDARKVRMARRLRAETSVTLKWIAEHLHMGTWTHVANRLSQHPAQPDTQSGLNLCQK
jgi:REP element-mobilizing transposase RayT